MSAKPEPPEAWKQAMDGLWRAWKQQAVKPPGKKRRKVRRKR